MIDIGIDFTKNNQPPRHVIFTDWEARLVEACLGRYLEAADAVEGEPTSPLARAALGKVTRGPLPRTVSVSERASARRRESRLVRELIEPTVQHGHIEQKWAGFAQALAEALEVADPGALRRMLVGRPGDGEGFTAAEWLQHRRAREKATA